jgi:hypothetical protein
MAAVSLAAVAAAGFIVLIAAVGWQLLASASSADKHRARAIDGPSTAASPTVAARTEPPSGADAAQQIFAELQRYYAANISQGNTIFWASLLSMCIGFAIIFAGVVSAGANGVTAVVAGLAGALGQFIAVTFLVVLRSTQQQATTYAQTLVELHLRDLTRSADERAVELGLRLLEQISADRTDPANATKAAIAFGLIVKQSPTIVEPPAAPVEIPTVDVPITERRNRSGTLTFDDTPGAERH